MRKLSLLLSMLVLCIFAFAQPRTVTGRVTDETGNALPFATITVKGTNTGASADQDGRFTISVPANATLVVSSQGRVTKEVAVGNQTTVNVTLQASASTTLSEVVVTGAYNTRRTARSTSYNAQVVTGEQLNVIRQTNVNNALAGKVSGLQVRSQSAAALGRQTEVRLRGTGGLGGGEGVIYVVDGTIVPNSDDINIDDIQDVTVLQGPAASAQFGSQGANGAIVITLKKGRRSAGVGVDVNIGAMFESVYIMPNYQNSYAGGSTSDLMKYTWRPGHPEEWKALDGKYYHDYSDDASWGPRMVGQEYIPWYSWYPGHSRTGTTALLTPQPDNAKDFFNTAFTTNNSVAFNKYTDVLSLRLSYGNIYTQGLIPQSNLIKNTFNLNTSVDVTKNLTLGANINYIAQQVNGEINDDYSNQSSGSFNQWFHRNVDMDIMKEMKDYRTPTGIYASWNHANPNAYNANSPRDFYAGNYWYNFYTWFDLARTFSNRDRLFGDISLSYKILDGLTVRGTFRKNMTTTWSEQRFRSELLESGLQTQGNEPRARGYYSTSESFSNRQNIEFLATYSRRFGDDFQINLNAGSDFFKWRYKDIGGNTNQGLNVPNLFTLANSKNPASTFNSRIEERYNAVFTRGDVGFRDFLFAEFSLRNDWYSTLPANNNDVLSKSFGASFVFSDLTRSATPWLSYGKIRASWGEIPKALGTSTTTFGAYRYPGFTYGLNQFQWNGNFLMSTPDQLVDSAIRGAVVRQKEIGLELRFLGNRLGLSTTYWDGTEEDFPYAISVNGASGFTSKLINTGKITKQGIDLQFMAIPIRTNNLRWEINATWGRILEQKVVSIAPGVSRITVQQLWGSTAPYLVHQEGREWGQIYGNGIKRIDGKPVLDANGFYVNDPDVYFGNILPEFTGGVQNSIQFLKNFTANFNIDFQKGGKFFSLSDMWGSYSGLTARTATVNDKGNPVRDAVADGGGIHVFGVDGTGKDVDYYVEAQDYFHNLYNNKTFDEFIYDLTFVKLREVSIGYNIPVNRLGIGRWINRANFSLVARNPVLIYAKTKDLDPSEISAISGERGQFPATRGIGFNLRVGF
ncbi:MAG TPA: SusC/RagA family TonB-linked outer membrane protein [Flavisolibacter sp.]|jgi:TonB-linked SusC/RagA family outer membrane protein|nr:SusC/RagA family TonB-linked outer membrane protein [Flavisolibacter sp.]